MKNSPRYQTDGNPEDDYQPGSDGQVLRNFLGIADPAAIGRAETVALQWAQIRSLEMFSPDHSFRARDLAAMHLAWLGTLYPWAGQWRTVNMSKGGFVFAAAHVIDSLMADYEASVLGRLTPCPHESGEALIHALACVHVEFLLIHPFREGNGRLGRWLATLMALQAGLPLLDFSLISDGEGREKYYEAVRSGLELNYEPMMGIFRDLVAYSLPPGVPRP